MTTIQEDNLRVGAEHYNTHTLAYIAHDRPFIDVELDDIGCGAVNVEPWSGRNDVIACIKMAGPAADFAYLGERDDEDSALKVTVDGWRELLDVDDPDDDALFSDQAVAASTGAMDYGFAWAAGFFKASRELIAEVGEMLRGADGYLEYDATVGQLHSADRDEFARMLTKVGTFAVEVDAVRSLVKGLSRDRLRHV